MSKFVVVVFPGETKAYDGARALRALDAEGSLTLYGMAVIAKDAKGNLAVKDAADEGPIGAAVGILVGGLIGVLGGPVGTIAGATGGALLGSLTDVFNFGVGEDFLTKVSNTLTPGKVAVVAEIGEDWTIPLDTRMESLGGTVLRTWRADFEDAQIEAEVAARNAELAELRAEHAQARADDKAKLKAKVDRAKAELANAETRLKSRLDAIETETKARIAALEKQAATARADTKERVRQRIASVRADLNARSGKLKQAWALTKEALAA
jgi:uncharacterized membrane protein